ncbi:MAG: aggregation factor core [Pseudomonadota bacterium]
MRRMTIWIAGMVVLSAGPLQAECLQALTVKFVESALRDRFDIIHTATGVFVTGVSIDLRGSAGALVFDTEEGGAGTEVFQPFRPDAGIEAAEIEDGARSIELTLQDLSAGQRTGFTIDVDDQREQSDLGQIRVTGGELAGAGVVFSLADDTEVSAVFDANNRAKACT